jgi:hypothetical protein
MIISVFKKLFIFLETVWYIKLKTICLFPDLTVLASKFNLADPFVPDPSQVHRGKEEGRFAGLGMVAG